MAEASRRGPASEQHVPLHVDLSPAYDLFQSLCLIALPLKKGRWSGWAKQIASQMRGTQWQGIRRWFGGDPPIGSAYMALVPLLPHSHDIEELLHMITELPMGDFLRIAVTAGSTDPEAPLSTEELLTLQAERERAQQFADHYLRITGRQRTHLLRVLTNPEVAHAELLALLQRYYKQIYAQIEPQVQDERARAADHLREMLQAQPASVHEWLNRGYNVRGFDPVVLAPSVFRDTGISAYAHEVHRSLLDGSSFEPLILIIGTQSILAAAQQGLQALASTTTLPDPAEQWASVFSMLADSSRLRLLHLLVERPYYEQELAAALNISGATISHHVTALVRAGLVRLERQAHRTYIVLQTEAFQTLFRESQQYLLGTL